MLSRFQFEADAWRSLLYLWRWRTGRHKVCIPFASAYPKAPLRAFFIASNWQLTRKKAESCDYGQGHDWRGNGRRGAEGPGRRHDLWLSGWRGAADLRRHLPPEQASPHS